MFIDPPAINPDGTLNKRLYQYMLLQHPTGSFTSKAEAREACESVGLNLVLPNNYNQNEHWKSLIKGGTNRGIILGLSFVVDGWYSHDTNKRIEWNDFLGANEANASPDKTYYLADSGNTWQEYTGRD